MAWFNFFQENKTDQTLNAITVNAFTVLGGVAVFLYCLWHLAKCEGGHARMMRELELEEDDFVPEIIQRRHSL